MIGGMVGTGCSGTNAYRYGTMREWVINLTVVLADGTIIKTRQRPRKSSAGFGSIKEAADCVGKVVTEGVPIAAIEILDDNQMLSINKAGTTSRKWHEAPTLFFKFAGTPNAVKEHISIVKKLANASGSKTFEFAKSQEDRLSCGVQGKKRYGLQWP
ncbi:hypothetical protein EYC84_004066 [Monilinia fructicola]|uniref:FAD-binding PCMH-type domain-containing protein n=1 Tax=Monilinia fructicola TaxID=38448 RepID=A0A5M9K302_MONFR|nr:hypothetical protein EYC84_004066 [Monilinia fructicola]